MQDQLKQLEGTIQHSQHDAVKGLCSELQRTEDKLHHSSSMLKQDVAEVKEQLRLLLAQQTSRSGDGADQHQLKLTRMIGWM